MKPKANPSPRSAPGSHRQDFNVVDVSAERWRSKPVGRARDRDILRAYHRLPRHSQQLVLEIIEQLADGEPE